MLMRGTTLTSVNITFKTRWFETNGYWVKQNGEIDPVVIPPFTNLINWLRLAYIERKSGKLYFPSTDAERLNNNYSNWQVICWGGGSTKVENIKVFNVLKYNVPRVLKLMDTLSGK